MAQSVEFVLIHAVPARALLLFWAGTIEQGAALPGTGAQQEQIITHARHAPGHLTGDWRDVRARGVLVIPSKLFPAPVLHFGRHE